MMLCYNRLDDVHTCKSLLYNFWDTLRIELDRTIISIPYVNHFHFPLTWQVKYKKGHDQRKAKYTSLADPPEVELAKKNFANRSNVSRKQKSGQSC